VLDSAQRCAGFVHELLATDDVTIKFITQLGIGRCRPVTRPSHRRHTTDWGTNRATALELIEDALNLRTPTIYDKVRDGKSDNRWSILAATEGAREKQQRSKTVSKQWIWQDDERRSGLPINTIRNSTASVSAFFNGDH